MISLIGLGKKIVGTGCHFTNESCAKEARVKKAPLNNAMATVHCECITSILKQTIVRRAPQNAKGRDKNMDELYNEIKDYRKSYFKSEPEMIAEGFAYYDYFNKKYTRNDYIKNASEIIENVRSYVYENIYLPAEEKFSVNFLCQDKYIESSGTIEDYINNHFDVIYKVCLSNTQSRRSNAGKDFELILKYLLLCMGIPFHYQASVGKVSDGQSKNGKQKVDFLIPGLVEYDESNNNCFIISAKTSLKERISEVFAESSRTSASVVYLATVDSEINQNNIINARNNNIICVTTQKNLDKIKAYYIEKKEDLEKALEKSQNELNDLTERLEKCKKDLENSANDKEKGRIQKTINSIQRSLDRCSKKIDKDNKELEKRRAQINNINLNLLSFEEMLKKIAEKYDEIWASYDYQASQLQKIKGKLSNEKQSYTLLWESSSTKSNSLNEIIKLYDKQIKQIEDKLK